MVNEYCSSPEQDVSTVLFNQYQAVLQDGSYKVWAVGLDARGVHTWFTEPKGSKLIYYFKPMATDFNGSMPNAEKYIERKRREKERKGYKHKGRKNFVSKTRTFSI